MTDILLFGGTAEGREIAELLQKKNISALVCVATGYGEALLEPCGSLRVHTGRLDEAGIAALIRSERPRLVVDATHPYALAVSDQVRAACEKCGTKRLRIERDCQKSDGYAEFQDMDALLSALNETDGTIFSTLGAKEAAALSKVCGFRERVWLRILPSVESLTMCLDAGFPAKHIICMQGPFSKEMNLAMLKATGANILLTKETGTAGGFLEKLDAARELGVFVAALKRAESKDENGITLEEFMQGIDGGTI